MNSLDEFGLVAKDRTHYQADSYSDLYTMHKYWSKKPSNIIREKILQNSEKGDVVLDPFCGSGVSITEAVFSERRAIGIDINPSAIFITKELLMWLDVRKAKEEFRRIEEDVQVVMKSLYSVKRNGKIYRVTHFLWNNNDLIQVWYEKDKEIIRELASDEDKKRASSYNYEMIRSFYPKDKLFLNTRINVNSNMYVYELFTPRNLLALSTIYERISEIHDPRLKHFFLFCFTGSLGQASKMVFAIKNRGKSTGIKINNESRYEVGSWVIGFWKPSLAFEINAWDTFARRVKKAFKARTSMPKKRFNIADTDSAGEFFRDGHIDALCLLDSAEHALRQIPTNSIDYVITDPPHGDREPYLELSTMWNGWLMNRPDYESEIVISDSPERGKNINDYLERLRGIIKEIGRVLKEGHTFTLIFNSLDDMIWRELLTYIVESHLKFVNLETMGYSANSVVQDTRKRGLKSDLILSFKKTSSYNYPKKLSVISETELRDGIVRSLDLELTKTEIGRVELYSQINSALIQLGKFMSPSVYFKFLENRNLFT